MLDSLQSSYLHLTLHSCDFFVRPMRLFNENRIIRQDVTSCVSPAQNKRIESRGKELLSRWWKRSCFLTLRLTYCSAQVRNDSLKIWLWTWTRASAHNNTFIYGTTRKINSQYSGFRNGKASYEWWWLTIAHSYYYYCTFAIVGAAISNAAESMAGSAKVLLGRNIFNGRGCAIPILPKTNSSGERAIQRAALFNTLLPR